MATTQLLARSALALCLVLGSARAETDAAVAGGGQGTTGGTTATSGGRGGDGGSDLDRVRGRLGVGWFGVTEIPLGDVGNRVDAPVIGVRYWFPGATMGLVRAMGLDLGVGLSLLGGEEDNADIAGHGGFLLHAGVPLVLAGGRHAAFEVVPEVNFGIAGGGDGAGTDFGGSRLDVGARAGLEVFFGFIGIPQLALEGTVGLFFSRESASTETPAGDQDDVQNRLNTRVFGSPWEILNGNVTIAARYYF